MGIDPVQADEKLIMFTRTKHFFPAVCALAFLVIASGASAQSLQDATGASNPCKDPLAALNPACPPAGSGTSGSGPSVSPNIPMLNMPGMSLPNMDGVSAPRMPREPEVRELPAAPISPDPPNEFQRFVAASVGKVLPIFGASLFEKIPSTFAPVGRVPVTAGYVVGPGDQILLRVWGQVNLNQELTVDRGGAVYIPQVGSITVSGLPFEKLSGFLRTQLERVFRNFDLSVNLGQLRSIQIFVVGKVRRPGAYTVSSLSTLVDALFSSGGPSAEGSMRRIQLRRASRLVSEFDLYDLLLKGDKSGDAALLDGDVIYVASAGPQAAVAGSVKNPAIYEMKAERTLGALLELSGGLTQVADGRRATLERVLNHDARQMLDLALDAAGLAIPLEDGDVLQILPVPLRFTNAVTLRGNVANPGRFPWHAGMRLRDIIPDRESLVTRSYWRNQNLLGFAPEIASAEMILDPAAKLALMNAGKSDAPKLALKPAVKLESADPPINWAYAVVERRNPRDLSAQLLPFSPARLLLENNLDENLELRPGDVVTIFSQTDIRVPQSQQVRFVRLEGELRAAGIYTAKDGETLKQLIDRAGGLTPEAYLYGAQFTRESTR
jgi:protein involved in polysaccharide export with SLBB domain